MTDPLRVILEIGKKKRVVAGAMDWPGPDRWGTSEDAAIETLLTYRPRYAAVAERAGMAKEFAKSDDPEVVERVPGVGSTDFWGIAHAPSEIEREVLSEADLERRLDLLSACWAYFDAMAARVSPELRLGPRGGGRSRDKIIGHVHRVEPGQFSDKVESGHPSTCLSPPTSLQHIGRRSSPRSAPTTRRASRPGPGRSNSSSAGWLTT